METKQPTLPEAIVLAKEALLTVRSQHKDILVTKALAALESLQVSELVGDHIEDVRGMVGRMKAAIEGECEGLAITDDVAKAILQYVIGNAAPCARCAEWDGDQYPGKEHIAALEAELKERDLQLRHLLCIIHRDGGHHTQAHGLEQSIEDAKEKFFDLRDLPATIAQQAERIRVLEEEDTETHLMKDKTIVMQGDELAQQAEEIARLKLDRDAIKAEWRKAHDIGVSRGEQLAAAEKDTERLDFLDKLNHALNSHYGTTYGWKLIFSPNIVRLMSGAGGNGRVSDIDLNDAEAHGSKSCRLAIDAAIAASKVK